MKRLNGWDSLLLSSETPNVHQHTLKIAVIDTSLFEGTPTFDAFRETLRLRISALDPLRYELVDIPLHLHRPMWREDAEIDLDYHVRRIEVPAPGGAARTRRGDRPDRQHATGPRPAVMGVVLRGRPGPESSRGDRQGTSCACRRRRIGESHSACDGMARLPVRRGAATRGGQSPYRSRVAARRGPRPCPTSEQAAERNSRRSGRHLPSTEAIAATQSASRTRRPVPTAHDVPESQALCRKNLRQREHFVDGTQSDQQGPRRDNQRFGVGDFCRRPAAAASGLRRPSRRSADRIGSRGHRHLPGPDHRQCAEHDAGIAAGAGR